MSSQPPDHLSTHCTDTDPQGFYSEYNRAFYSCRWTRMEAFSPYTQLLLSGLTHLSQSAPQKSPQPGTPMTVYRYQSYSKEVLKDLQRLAGAPDVPAYWYVIWNFFSTSKDRKVATNLLAGRSNKGIVYEMDVFEGAFIKKYSAVKAESEVLLPCCTCHHVVSVKPGDATKAPASTYWMVRLQQRPCNGMTPGQGQLQSK